MKTQETNPADDRHARDRWARVHGEAGASASAEWDEALKHDPELRAAMAETAALDGLLHRLMPLVAVSPETLENEILSAIDGENASPVPAARPPTTPALWRLLTASAFQRTSAVLALAASATLVLSALRFDGGPVAWAQPELVSTVMRGAPGAARYTADDAARGFTVLKRAVAAQVHPGAANGASSPWQLHFRFQEHPQAGLTIVVDAESLSGAARAQHWERTYPDIETFVEDADALARDMDRDLQAR